MEKLYSSVAEKISLSSGSLPDQTKLIDISISLTSSHIPRYRLNDDWTSLATSLNRKEKTIIKSSLSIARNDLKIPTLKYLRRTPESELIRAQKIGLGRIAILKAFGENIDSNLTLEYFKDNIEDIFIETYMFNQMESNQESETHI
jgi:hypothetical protein